VPCKLHQAPKNHLDVIASAMLFTKDGSNKGNQIRTGDLFLFNYFLVSHLRPSACIQKTPTATLAYMNSYGNLLIWIKIWRHFHLFRTYLLSNLALFKFAEALVRIRGSLHCGLSLTLAPLAFPVAYDFLDGYGSGLAFFLVFFFIGFRSGRSFVGYPETYSSASCFDNPGAFTLPDAAARKNLAWDFETGGIYIAPIC
jgi:hypothetical protein